MNTLELFHLKLIVHPDIAGMPLYSSFIASEYMTLEHFK